MDSVNAQEMYERMKAKLSNVVPDAELRIKAELAAEINQLKKERNAIILGHNYMEAALFHSVPDFTGDSLELSRKAAETDKDVIVFCGVRFMAETAKILSPDKTVLLPAKKAGCSLAEAITAEDVRNLRKRFPGVPVITYVNTYADVKAECDICCTSGNAKQVVESMGSGTVIFLPDQYLARNVAKETGRSIVFPDEIADGDDVSQYGIIGWKGACEVHEQFTVEDITNARKQFPGVTVLAHPECPPEVCDASDYSGSTSGMVKHAKECDSDTLLILTECAMGDNIAAENPDKDIVRVCSIRCPHMNEITLEETRDALLHDQYVIEVPEETRVRALASVRRMLEIGPSGEFKRS
jgi:quinolinate synthase